MQMLKLYLFFFLSLFHVMVDYIPPSLTGFLPLQKLERTGTGAKPAINCLKTRLSSESVWKTKQEILNDKILN